MTQHRKSRRSGIRRIIYYELRPSSAAARPLARRRLQVAWILLKLGVNISVPIARRYGIACDNQRNTFCSDNLAGINRRYRIGVYSELSFVDR